MDLPYRIFEDIKRNAEVCAVLYESLAGRIVHQPLLKTQILAEFLFKPLVTNDRNCSVVPVFVAEIKSTILCDIFVDNRSCLRLNGYRYFFFTALLRGGLFADKCYSIAVEPCVHKVCEVDSGAIERQHE